MFSTCSTYKTAYTVACQHTTPYHNCTYSRLPEDEPSGSKHVEDIVNLKNQNIKLGNLYFVGS
jgi:hypothetical protein